MRLLEILMVQRKFNNLNNSESFIYHDNQIYMKFFLNTDMSFISLFESNGGEYICSLEMRDGLILWNTFDSNPSDIELEESDIIEDESFLTLKYGRYFSKDILDKINMSMDSLEKIILDSIQNYKKEN